MKRIFPPTFYNTITFLGAAVASISFGLFLFLMILDFFAAEQKPYMGIITFIVLPIFLLLGLAIGAVGVWREHRREQRGLPVGKHLPQIDLNNPQHRKAVVSIGLATVVLLFFSAFGSFKAYEYTDSDAFCGTMCHKVMEPEYTAYQNSPHARVGCVKCHIGPGAGWFVRSKLSGAYQVYSTIFNKYSHPIATPIENLRPAQETCEQCHWPKHFFSEMKVSKTYFLSDEHNTKWTLDMAIKVGGGNTEAGPTSGIHWHMNIANEITYAATDKQRQIIPWVKVKNKTTGEEHVYKSTESVSDSVLAHSEKRTMDCIDCHNRPSHSYNPPARSIEHVMAAGWIDPALPYSKTVSMNVLDKMYSSAQTAQDSIRRGVEEYYQTNYPSIMSSQKNKIGRMVVELQKIYSRNDFPTMGSWWKQYPNNIGHMYYPGCFRCHDGNHVRDDGKVLSKDCNVCHTLLAQQYENKEQRVSLAGLEYQHPVDIGDSWKEMRCSDCHAAQ
jgi:nitrate/TMAO reductase-like tetraheme cytochrome c subunit